MRRLCDRPRYRVVLRVLDTLARWIALAAGARIREERLPRSVEELLGGSSEAWGELYIAFAGDVRATAWQVLGTAEDAEDVMQEVFLGLPSALESYDHSSVYGFGRWLERVTERLALERASEIGATREVSLGAIPAAAARSPRPIEKIALERALKKLSPALREVFVHKVVEGYSHREISALLGISARASAVRLHRARKALRAMLG